MYTRSQILEHHEEASKADQDLKVEILTLVGKVLDDWKPAEPYEPFYMNKEHSVNDVIAEHLEKWYEDIDNDMMRISPSSILMRIPADEGRSTSLNSYLTNLSNSFRLMDHYDECVQEVNQLLLDYLQKYYGQKTDYGFRIGYQAHHNEFVFS